MIEWEKLVKLEGPVVWRTAWRLLANRADVDEVFQETFIDAFRFAQSQPVTHWRTVLQRIATARSIDRLRVRIRRRGREEPLPDDLPTSDMAMIHALESELSEPLRAALGAIHPKHAEVFCLFHLEDWTYPEIAEHLGISTDVVGVWLHRTRGRLQTLLRKNEVLP